MKRGTAFIIFIDDMVPHMDIVLNYFLQVVKRSVRNPVLSGMNNRSAAGTKVTFGC